VPHGTRDNHLPAVSYLRTVSSEIWENQTLHRMGVHPRTRFIENADDLRRLTTRSRHGVRGTGIELGSLAAGQNKVLFTKL
jgi:hypothetical protein